MIPILEFLLFALSQTPALDGCFILLHELVCSNRGLQKLCDIVLWSWLLYIHQRSRWPTILHNVITNSFGEFSFFLYPSDKLQAPGTGKFCRLRSAIPDQVES
ncbi:uncharacterized protein G2W53_040419 [Senna tora]|uniref:Secreted protein n=1 Tax=Senna tora TaxID=362788 RepID=A0A834SCZ0_9FABA|nr:uncharacterized protein G2W53_040419 [Senna tora]